MSVPSLSSTPRPSPDRPPTTAAPAAESGPETNPLFAPTTSDPDRSVGGLLGEIRTRALGGLRTTSSAGEDEDQDDDDRRPPRKRERVDVHAVAATLGQLFVVLAGLGAWLASRSGRELRPPTPEERSDVADPLAAILVRRTGTVFLTADLVDGVRAAAGVTSYIQTAPLQRVGPPPADPDDDNLPDGWEQP